MTIGSMTLLNTTYDEMMSFTRFLPQLVTQSQLVVKLQFGVVNVSVNEVCNFKIWAAAFHIARNVDQEKLTTMEDATTVNLNIIQASHVIMPVMQSSYH